MNAPAVVHSLRYRADIGAHVFPMEKFGLVREEIVRRGLLADAEILEPQAASEEDVLRVHDRAYVDKLVHGKLSVLEETILELPYSKQLVDASFLCAGGSILAAREAIRRGAGINLGGGFHHAFPDHGEGFCVFHDVAIAIRALQHEGTLRRAAVIDLDVHQGNGTAAIFRGDSTVYTFSAHDEHNYPAVKPPSDLDLGFESGTRGGEYLAALERHVPAILDRNRPDLVAYIAGADPYEEDQLGSLKLTREDLRQRDRIVFDSCSERSIPVVAFLAGGYAARVEDTVGIHADMVEAAFATAGADRG